MEKNYALITGGSSGIGFEIAKDLANRGYNIILVSRNEQNLQDCCKHLSEEFNVSSDYISSDLANKESDRIIEMQNILDQINIKSKFSKGEFKIYGQGMIDASYKTIRVPNLSDHRICMSSFVLAALTGAKTKIKNFETVFTSSPSFVKIMKKLGARFEIQK